MGTAGNALLTGIDPVELAGELDRFYCYHLSVLHWSEAVRNRLSGPAAFLIERTLVEVADESLGAARRIARRVGELGGAVTADPSRFVERSPIDDYALPEDSSDVASILAYALERVRTVIEEYGRLLQSVRDRDPITERLALELLAAEVTREDEMENALGPKAAVR